MDVGSVIVGSLKVVCTTITAVILSTSPLHADDDSWIYHSERQVIGGDIIHWGTGVGESPEVALFKARHMAIKSIMEECGGFAHSDIIPRRQKVDISGGEYKAYAQADISFASCDEAKRGHGKQNPKIVEGQKIYDQAISRKLMPKEDPKDDVELIEKMHAFMRNERDGYNHRIGALQNRISELESKARGDSPLQIAQRNYTTPTPAKQACLSQLQQMMYQMRQTAEPNGNEAYSPMFNSVMQQKALCQSL